MKQRTLNVRLQRDEWIKLNFIIGYRSKTIIWITLVGFGMLYTVVDYLLWNSYNEAQFPFIQLIFAILILGVIPISTYITASRNFNFNPWVFETARYDLDSSKISVNGTSYQVSIDWPNIKSIKELKNWIIIYTETKRGFFIPKRVFKSNEELNDFRNDLKGTPVTKKKLKKEQNGG